MKKMTKSLVVASLVSLLGAYAYAYADNATLNTAVVDSKEQAYDLGFQKLADLKALGSGDELSKELKLYLFSHNEKRSTELQNGYITVEEFMDEEGDIMYRAKVNVKYSFSPDQDDD